MEEEKNYNQNAQVMENQSEKVAEKPITPKEGGIGALIGSIIVIILLIIGTIYLWNVKVINNNQPEINDEDLAPLSKSDELNALEQDLQNTNIDFDTEFNNVDLTL